MKKNEDLLSNAYKNRWQNKKKKLGFKKFLKMKKEKKSRIKIVGNPIKIKISKTKQQFIIFNKFDRKLSKEKFNKKCKTLIFS